MNYLHVFAILMLALLACGCTAAPPALPQEHDEMLNRVEEGPAAKNVDLFGQDFSQKVSTKDIDEPLGFLAKPAQPGEYPGIVMIHEWWGLNANIKEMAQILANEGYIVFAVDLYEGKVAATSEEAQQLVGSVRSNPGAAIDKMKAAVAYLKEQQKVQKVGSVGWCFGGGQSLQLSLNEETDATVIYYGSLVNDTAQLKKLKGSVLGIFGENDSSIPVSSVNSFIVALDNAGIINDVYIYPGVGHAFANPSGNSYAAEETVDAWGKTVAFLNEELKVSKAPNTPNEEKNDADAAVSSAVTATFKLTGENFKFLMDGKENPELRVKKGDRVRIEFTSTQGFHDWVVDEFNASTKQVWAVNSTFVEFVADKKGTFDYYCSVGRHREMGMKGNLVVE